MTIEEKLSQIISSAQYALTIINEACDLVIRNDSDPEDLGGIKSTIELIRAYAAETSKRIDKEEMEAERA